MKYAILALIILSAALASADTYKWTDRNGMHFTDNLASVPKKYRAKALAGASDDITTRDPEIARSVENGNRKRAYREAVEAREQAAMEEQQARNRAEIAVREAEYRAEQAAKRDALAKAQLVEKEHKQMLRDIDRDVDAKIDSATAVIQSRMQSEIDLINNRRMIGY